MSSVDLIREEAILLLHLIRGWVLLQVQLVIRGVGEESSGPSRLLARLHYSFMFFMVEARQLRFLKDLATTILVAEDPLTLLAFHLEVH